MKLTRLVSAGQACLMAIGVFGIVSVANAETGGSARTTSYKAAYHAARAADARSRIFRQRLLPSPSLLYQDYRYYHSRGFYPTHIKSCLWSPCYAYHRPHDVSGTKSRVWVSRNRVRKY